MAITPQTFNGGGDVVLNSFFNGITNAYNRNQARIAQEQQLEAKQLEDQQKELSEIVKKVNTTGIQQQDISDLNTKLNSIYDTYYKANKATTREDRLKLRMDLEREITEMGSFVSQSKQRGIDQLKLADYQAKNPALFSPQSTKKFLELSNQPTSKIGAGAFTADRFISPDTSYLSKTIEDSAKSLLTNANVSRRTGNREQIGNQMTTQQFEDRVVGKDIFATDLLAKYNSDVKFKNLTDYTAGQLGLKPQDYIMSVVDEYDKASKLRQVRQLDPITDRVPRSSGSGDSNSDAPDPIRITIPYNDNKANVSFNEYVPISVPNKNFAGSKSIDLATGKANTEVLPPSSKYEIVGIANAPTIKAGKGRESDPLNGALAQPNFVQRYPNNVQYKPIIHVKLTEDGRDEDYFIPYDRLPVNIKNSKAIKSAIGKFRPATGQTANPTPTSTPRTTTTTKKKAIPNF